MMGKEKKEHLLCTITGIVVHGRGIGKFAGTPTANLAPAPETVLPENGVYISKVLLATQTYYGATHIGTRPTVDGNPDISIETILLDFHREIYGCKIELQLYHKLRPVKEYRNFSLLHRQIQKDCAAVRRFWEIPSAFSKPGSELKITPASRTVSVNGQEVYLSAKEFQVLNLLHANPDAAFTKEQIYEAVWEEPANGCCHAVENTVFQIRKKLRPFSGEYGFIRTLAGYGYRYDPCR